MHSTLRPHHRMIAPPTCTGCVLLLMRRGLPRTLQRRRRHDNAGHTASLVLCALDKRTRRRAAHRAASCEQNQAHGRGGCQGGRLCCRRLSNALTQQPRLRYLATVGLSAHVCCLMAAPRCASRKRSLPGGQACHDGLCRS